MSTAPTIEDRVGKLEKGLAELAGDASCNVNRIDTGVVGLRAEIAVLGRRVSELERQVK
jgi:hypothetical protein